MKGLVGGCEARGDSRGGQCSLEKSKQLVKPQPGGPGSCLALQPQAPQAALPPSVDQRSMGPGGRQGQGEIKGTPRDRHRMETETETGRWRHGDRDTETGRPRDMETETQRQGDMERDR
ncbi:hypothetical protein P7K49_034462 [Saguinus oedipus]|uniref:Uncharacterized protein n=1 Tax=Saguinus oedipus TaxID=9490 RepID=A0ABQ9TVM8_SAGOE|nr:hypothetical protein P7K49_034462 [Saguinus oedipus]